MAIDRIKMAQILVDIGSAPFDEGSFERANRGFSALIDLSDEELAFMLISLRGGGSAAQQQLESIRSGIQSLIDLRISQRQQEQAQALTRAIEQLKETETVLEKTVDGLTKAAAVFGPLLAKIGGG